MSITVSTTAVIHPWPADAVDEDPLSTALWTCPDGFEWRSDVQLEPAGAGELISPLDACGPFLVRRSDRQRRVLPAPRIRGVDQPRLRRVATEFAGLAEGDDDARRERACQYAGEHGWLGHWLGVMPVWPPMAESWELWRSESSAALAVLQMIRWAGNIRRANDEASRRRILELAVRAQASEIIDQTCRPRFGGLDMHISPRHRGHHPAQWRIPANEDPRPDDPTVITLTEESWSNNAELVTRSEFAVAVWLSGRLAGEMGATPYPRREIRHQPLNGLAAVHLGLALQLTRPNPAKREKKCDVCGEVFPYERSTRKYCSDGCRQAAHEHGQAAKRGR